MNKYLKIITDFIKKLGTPFPSRDWYAVLIISGLIFIALLFVALYYFIGIQSGVIIVPKGEDAIPTQSVSREDIKSVLERFNEIELNFDSGNVKTPDVSNPAR